MKMAGKEKRLAVFACDQQNDQGLTEMRRAGQIGFGAGQAVSWNEFTRIDWVIDQRLELKQLKEERGRSRSFFFWGFAPQRSLLVLKVEKKKVGLLKDG